MYEDEEMGCHETGSGFECEYCGGEMGDDVELSMGHHVGCGN